MPYDVAVAWTWAAAFSWGAALLGAPYNGVIAAGLLSQVIWLTYKSF